jgi:hypothetical protein
VLGGIGCLPLVRRLLDMLAKLGALIEETEDRLSSRQSSVEYRCQMLHLTRRAAIRASGLRSGADADHAGSLVGVKPSVAHAIDRDAVEGDRWPGAGMPAKSPAWSA